MTIRKLSKEAAHASAKEISKALLILRHTHQSASSLFGAFEKLRKMRAPKQGTTTDSEQDILRAMLVLATAGLDSMTKQVIKDALPRLAETDDKVEQGLETFVARQIKGETDLFANSKFLAKLLVAKSRREKIIQEYVNDLTGGSLQSPEELMKAVYALGVDPAKCHIVSDQLRSVFRVRNTIIHELDINFDAPRRRRHNRRLDHMVRDTNKILLIAEKILLEVTTKLA